MKLVADREDFVPASSELVRISKIPRRVMLPEDAEWLAHELTLRLRKPRGTMTLRPLQGWALFELGTVGGLFGPIPVGEGKTLVSMLAPIVMKSERPLLIVPAGLVEKTKRDKEVLEQHWHLPHFIRIMSYEWLGRTQAGEDVKTGKKSAIEEWDPDLVILDEAHRAKNNRGAAVARRLTRFFRNRSRQKPVACVAMSGTMTKRSIQDYAHVLAWALPAQLVPVPLHWNELKLWSEALDEKKDQYVQRIDPGALEILCADDKDRELWRTDRLDAARRTYQRRLLETPGVVSAKETGVASTLVVRGVGFHPGPAVDEAFEEMRENWVTPDGWSIPDGLAFSRHARELALGFFLRWDPRPPEGWKQARTKWHQFVRKVLKHSRVHDSEKQVRSHVLHSLLKLVPEEHHAAVKDVVSPHKDPEKRLLTVQQRIEYAQQLVEAIKEGRDPEVVAGEVALLTWKGLEETFEPNTVPVWIDSAACDFAAAWAKRNVGIVWVEHRCVGQRLRDEFGLPYYGRKGLDDQGRFIDDHDAKKSFVASRPANSEGRNLQKWSKNLITSLLPNGARNEQLFGRTHRTGQLADEVEVEFLVSCLEHLEGFDQAMNDARYIQASTGAPQKLLLATIDVDEKSLRGVGPRWVKLEKEGED